MSSGTLSSVDWSEIIDVIVCTIGYHRDLGVIFKNRDKQSPTAEEIFHDGRILACRTIGADYYSWGINAHGCAFVSAAINTPLWTRLVYHGDLAAADRKFTEENAGLENPVVKVSAMLPEARQVGDWTKVLSSNSWLSMGYNIIFADSRGAVVMECHKDQRRLRELRPREAVTNHFQEIGFGPRSREDYLSSFRRYDYANGLLPEAETLEGVFAMLKPSEEKRRRQIWRQGTFLTVSTSVLSFNTGVAYYSKSFDEDYHHFRLDSHEGSERNG